MKRIFILGVMCLLLCSCGENKDKEIDTKKIVTCSEMKDLVTNDGAVLIDVRTDIEYREAHLDGAINLNYETIDKTIGSKVEDKNTKIVVYCRSGQRSATAKATLEKLGYKNVYDLGSIQNCNE